MLHKDIGAFGVDEKRIYPYLGELINYPNGDYYGGFDVGFNFDMLQQLRRYTDFTTTYSDPDIGSSMYSIWCLQCNEGRCKI